MSPFGMRSTTISIRSTTYILVSLTSFRLEKVAAFSSRVGRAHNEGIADLVFSASRRSEMSLQIASFHLDRIIVVLTVLELVREITWLPSSASSATREFHLSPAFLITLVILLSADRLFLISSRFSARI